MAENNDGLFIDTCRKLWEACGDKQSWKSGYTERLGKNLFSMMIDPHNFPGFNETTAQAAFDNYIRRKSHLTISGFLDV